MTRAPKAVPVVDWDGLVARARERIEAEGFVKVSALGPAAARAGVAERLRGLGFEATKSAVRRPLRDQLLDAVAQGAYMPMKSIAAFVRGGTSTEVKAVVAALFAEGHVARVMRGNAEVVVPLSAPTYTLGELRDRARAVEVLGKALAKAVRLKGVSMLRSDVRESIEEAFPELTRSARLAAPTNETSDPAGAEVKLLAALDATRDGSLGLSFIPLVVRHLAREMGVDAARKSLLAAAARGLVELRPEGGISRLNSEELALCLPGPQGTRLSWARRIEGRTS